MAVPTESAVSDQPATSSTVVGSPSPAIAGITRVPPPVNEPNLGYLPGSVERAALKERLKAMAAERVDIPIVIGGREIRTGRTHEVVMPHDHQHVLGHWHAADPEHVHAAIAASKAAARDWANWRWEDRAAVFMRLICQ